MDILLLYPKTEQEMSVLLALTDLMQIRNKRIESEAKDSFLEGLERSLTEIELHRNGKKELQSWDAFFADFQQTKVTN